MCAAKRPCSFACPYKCAGALTGSDPSDGGVDLIWQEKNPDLHKEPFTLEAAHLAEWGIVSRLQACCYKGWNDLKHTPKLLLVTSK